VHSFLLPAFEIEGKQTDIFETLLETRKKLQLANEQVHRATQQMIYDPEHL